MQCCTNVLGTLLCDRQLQHSHAFKSWQDHDLAGNFCSTLLIEIMTAAGLLGSSTNSLTLLEHPHRPQTLKNL
jgi:hypothetical protein